MSFGLSRGRQLDISGYGILASDLPPMEEGLIDPRDWFGAERAGLPFHLEIGSGKGTFLVQQAELTPDINYLGIEWAKEFFRYASDRVRRRGLMNVRLLNADAVEFIRYRMPDAIVDVIHIYFPDPWPKKRHHKRRSIQEGNLREFHRVLHEDGGEIRIVTDHDDYWEWIQDHVAKCGDSLFEVREFGGADSAGEGEVVGTNFERKYRRERRPFHSTRLVVKG